MLDQFVAIEEASRRDELTGLNNRRFLFDTGNTLFANAKRNKLALIAAMVDVDHFKAVNDTHGHAAGDQVLKHIGTILKKRFRSADVVARFGGEEFCILCSNMDSSQVFKIFDGLREDIQNTEIRIDDLHIRVTVSIGVCLELLDSLDAMIKKADTLLYEAKRKGRNRVVGQK